MIKIEENKGDMMNTIKARFDFFKVKPISDASVDFLQILNEISCLSPNDAQADIDGETCLISKSETFGKTVSVLFTKIRMNNLPQKTKATGERTPLDLDDDEGLGEDVAIGYNSELRVIAIQRNIHSLSVNNILRLIKEINPACDVEFVPIIKRDALERFLNFDQLRRVRIKLNGTGDLSFLDKDGISNQLSNQLFFEEPYIECVWSVGRKKDRLSDKLKDFIEQLARKVKGNKPVALCNLEVTGKETETDPSITIDLLEDRLIAHKDIPVNPNGRSVDIQCLLIAVADVIKENYPELAKQ